MKKSLVIIFFLIIFSGFAYGGGGGKVGISIEPKYYSFEDLRYFLRQESFYFANANKPILAKVDLGYAPFYPASTGDFVTISSAVLSDPASYRVNTMVALANWNDSLEINFDDNSWSGLKAGGGIKGDLIFTRGNSKANNLVKLFSNWTHVAMVDDPYAQTVFEATPDKGVQVNETRITWGPITYYSCKKIDDLSDQQKHNAVESAKIVYQDKPYFPQIRTTMGPGYFLYKWSNKYDMESMYCSKLVFNAFRPYISLDTNNTGILNDKLQEKALGAPLFCWVGVSPDDIYYSNALGADFAYSQNLDYL